MPAPQQRRPVLPWPVLLAARHELQSGSTYNQAVSALTGMRDRGDFGVWRGVLADIRSALSFILQARHAGDTLTSNIFGGTRRNPILPFNPNQPRQYQMIVGARVHYGRGVRIKDVYITLNSDTLPSAADIQQALQAAIAHGEEHYGERPATLIDGYHIREAYAG